MTQVTYAPPTGAEVNDLINHLHRVADRLDLEVSDAALETGLTERQDILDRYDARQRLVRRMVRVAHELNSMLPDRLAQPVLDQPSEYGRSDDGSA